MLHVQCMHVEGTASTMVHSTNASYMHTQTHAHTHTHTLAYSSPESSQHLYLLGNTDG